MWVASPALRCLSACATGWSARPEENLMQYIQQPQAIEAKSFDIISDHRRNATGLPFRQPAARGDYQAGDPHHR